MRGHEPLIAMRLSGKRPPMVRFECDAMPWRDWANWPEWTAVPMVEVQPADVVRRLDLRCVVGLPAVVGGTDPQRVSDMAKALRKAGASLVIEMVDDHRGDAVTVAMGDEVSTWPM